MSPRRFSELIQNLVSAADVALQSESLSLEGTLFRQLVRPLEGRCLLLSERDLVYFGVEFWDPSLELEVVLNDGEPAFFYCFSVPKCSEWAVEAISQAGSRLDALKGRNKLAEEMMTSLLHPGGHFGDAMAGPAKNIEVPKAFFRVVDYVYQTTGGGVGIRIQPGEDGRLGPVREDLRTGRRVRYAITSLTKDDRWVERQELGRPHPLRGQGR